MLNVKSSEKFPSPYQNGGKFWWFWGLGVSGFKKIAIFTPKGTSVREFTSIKPFCVKIGWTV